MRFVRPLVCTITTNLNKKMQHACCYAAAYISLRKLQNTYSAITINQMIITTFSYLYVPGWWFAVLNGIHWFPTRDREMLSRGWSEGFSPESAPLTFNTWAVQNLNHGLDATYPAQWHHEYVLNQAYVAPTSGTRPTRLQNSQIFLYTNDYRYSDLIGAFRQRLPLNKHIEQDIYTLEWVRLEGLLPNLVAAAGTIGTYVKQLEKLSRAYSATTVANATVTGLAPKYRGYKAFFVTQSVANSLRQLGVPITTPRLQTSTRNNPLNTTLRRIWYANRKFLRDPNLGWEVGQRNKTLLFDSVNAGSRTYYAFGDLKEFRGAQRLGVIVETFGLFYSIKHGFRMPENSLGLVISSSRRLRPKTTKRLAARTNLRHPAPTFQHPDLTPTYVCVRAPNRKVRPRLFFFTKTLSQGRSAPVEMPYSPFVTHSVDRYVFKRPKVLNGITLIAKRDNFSILRITHAFSKSRFSRSRQYCRPIVIWSLYVNIGFLYACQIFFYGLTFKVSYGAQLAYLALIPYLVYYSTSNATLRHTIKLRRRILTASAMIARIFKSLKRWWK